MLSVEWCNQYRSIKYPFKYANKGHGSGYNKILKQFQQNKPLCIVEIKMDYDYRYLSSCEGEYLVLTLTTENLMFSDFHFTWINKIMFFMVKVIQLIRFSINQIFSVTNIIFNVVYKEVFQIMK